MNMTIIIVLVNYIPILAGGFIVWKGTRQNQNTTKFDIFCIFIFVLIIIVGLFYLTNYQLVCDECMESLHQNMGGGIRR